MVLIHSVIYRMRMDLITRLRDSIEKRWNFLPGGVFCSTHLQAIYDTKINRYEFSKQNIYRKK